MDVINERAFYRKLIKPPKIEKKLVINLCSDCVCNSPQATLLGKIL